MSQDRLGLFDTPYDRREVRACLAIVGLLVLGALALLPVRNMPVGHVEPFIPMVDAFMFLADLTTAALLYAQAAVFRSRALTVLATGFAPSPVPMMSRITPPMPVFAPPYGSSADG